MNDNRHTPVVQAAARKNALRKSMLAQRRTQSADARLLASQTICTRLLYELSKQEPGVIAGYLAVNGEVDIQPALIALEQSGWRLALPVIRHYPPGHMHFHQWQPENQLVPNQYGIQEPARANPVDTDIQILLVPLVAFNQDHFRLGMGGGFYDRWLAHHASSGLQTIGIGYAWQQIDALPVDSWDQAMRKIITDQADA